MARSDVDAPEVLALNMAALPALLLQLLALAASKPAAGETATILVNTSMPAASTCRHQQPAGGAAAAGAAAAGAQWQCPSLASAVTVANSRGLQPSPTILLSGTHAIPTTLELHQPMTLSGGGASAATLTGAGSANGELLLITASGVTLRRITVADANATLAGDRAAPLSVSGQNTVIDQCRFRNLHGLNGGAVFLLHGTLSLSGTEFEDCHAHGADSGGGGGAIYNDGGFLVVANSTFHGCSARQGGGAIWTTLGKQLGKDTPKL